MPTAVLIAISAASCYLGSAALLSIARRAHPPSRPEWDPTPLERGLHRTKRVLGLVLTVAVIAIVLSAVHARSAQPASGEYIPTPAGPPASSDAGGGR